MRDVRRLDSTENVVAALTQADQSPYGEAVFPTIMELLVFAAAVGFRLGLREDVPGGREVPIRVFERARKDGLILMLGLIADGNVEFLSEKGDVVDPFEEFAAAGLLEIRKWLSESPEESPADILLRKIQEQISSSDEPPPIPSVI
jgi:dnd system-associated protein 4